MDKKQSMSQKYEIENEMSLLPDNVREFVSKYDVSICFDASRGKIKIKDIDEIIIRDKGLIKHFLTHYAR